MIVRMKRWHRVLVIILLVFALLVGASYLVYSQLDSGRIAPLGLLALAAVISLAIPMIRSNFFPSVRDCEAEYAFHEKRLERAIVDRIEETLGSGARQGLFSTPDQYQPSASDLIQQWLAQEAITANPEVHFALLVSLARLYEKQGDPQASLTAWQEALTIQPQHFIARMHLAGNYEWIGDREGARRHYQHILDHPETLSRAMIRMVSAKIKATATTA